MVHPADDRYPCNHDRYPRDHGRYPCDNPPLYHQSRRPYPMGTTDRTTAYDIPMMGGAIVSSRASDRERIAQEQKTSHYNIANLATPRYHGDEAGVLVLM